MGRYGLRHFCPWMSSRLLQSSWPESARPPRASTPSTTPGAPPRRLGKAEPSSEQRAADGYLKVLSLAEQEAQWHEAVVFNLGYCVADFPGRAGAASATPTARDVPVRDRGRRDGGARRGLASQRLGSVPWSSGQSPGR